MSKLEVWSTIAGMDYIDAHCHLADPRFQDMESVLTRSRAQGVCRWVQGGVSPADWDQQRALASRFSGIAISFGLHPWWVSSTSEDEISAAFAHLEKELNAAVALGELGLDFGPKFVDARAKQVHWFTAQLALAHRAPKPLVLHIVRAHGEALAILEAAAPFPAGGIVHSFSGTLEVANRYAALGFLLSVSGVITRGGYKDLKHAVKHLPLEKIVIETDAPDQAPQGIASSEPGNLIEIAKAVGALRGESASVILESSAHRLRALFFEGH